MNSPSVTPLPRRLAAAWSTYTTRPMWWWFLGIAGLVLLLTLVVAPRNDEPFDPEEIVLVPIWLSVAPIVFAALLGLHIKSQFVTPAARVMPTYRTPHLAVVVMLTLLVLGVVPLVTAVGYGLSPLGAMTLAISIATLTYWAHHHRLAALPAVAILFSLPEPLVARFWFDPAVNGWPLRLAILIAGWWGFARWLRHVHAMHEERSDYLIPPIGAAFHRPSRSERAEQRKIAARAIQKHPYWIAWLLDPRIDRTLARPRPLRFVELMRLGNGPQSTETRALLGCAMFGVMWVGMAEWIDPQMIRQAPLMACFMPTILMSTLIEPKKPLIETELLRPVTRGRYYSTLLTEWLRDALFFAAGLATFVIVLYSVYLPKYVTPANLVMLVSYVAACNLLLCSFSALLASKFNAMARMTILYVPMMAMIGLGVWLWSLHESYGVGPLLAAALVYGVIAALLLRAAHRRWCNYEAG
ncbi:hypothetical protein Pla108_14720 [Botrimarina colliarenosi]|uniref:Uncharacterized protein n=1 Tax=Botrimarina colliarenosi TaxID=2528001 RepID=A0A5C6ALK6_9BACT|nr:hypothetical protein [Botrimarina colliarenosi]TWU00520.1 hypothetical protein Pla108_14720 [Botrimarina colliarenosi]